MNSNSHLSKIVSDINKKHSTQKNVGTESIEKILDEADDGIDLDALLNGYADDSETASGTNLDKLYKAKSLEQFILSLHPFTENQKNVIRHRFIENLTYDKTGKLYNKTRQWAEVIERAVKKTLLNDKNRPCFEEIFLFVRSAFLAEKDCLLSEEKLLKAARKRFGWNNLKVASLFKLCLLTKSKKNFLFEVAPSMIWTETDGIIRIKKQIQPSLLNRLRVALREVMKDFGKEGATSEEIIREFQKRYPDIPITKRIIETHASTKIPLGLQEPYVYLIPFTKGTRSVMTTFVLDSLYLADANLVEKLLRIGDEIKDYMKETGLAVISLHNIWEKHCNELQLPEMGFYMLLRSVKGGGLSYDDYPRVAYPGFHDVKASYHWAWYQYCKMCGIKEATRNQLFGFLAGTFGIGEYMALNSSFPLMNLKTNPKNGKYIVASPNPSVSEKDEPKLFLKTISDKKDFSLADTDWRTCKYPGTSRPKSTTISIYTRSFFTELQNAKVKLSDEILKQLCNADWSQKNLYSRSAVLSKEKVTTPSLKKSYWPQPVTLNGKPFYICCIWTAKAKAAFDVWAGKIAEKTNIDWPPKEQ